jgi:S-(hydroxymethyl)glutathione dehydrogenase/alcohol dehydrogenase
MTNIPATMRAAVLEDRAPSLRLLEIAVPEPRPGEALIRVAACGVCHTDLHVMKNEVAFPRPAVLGHEVSGTIVAFGADADPWRSGFAVGDPVVAGFIMPCEECAQCRAGRDDLCSRFFADNRLRGVLYDGTSRLRMPGGGFLAMYSMGGLAEYAVVPLSALAKLPASVDLADACILGCAGLTSYAAVARAGEVGEGRTVAVLGCGGIGSSIIQMARAAGAVEVVAIDVTAEKLAQALSMGATQALNTREVDVVQEVLDRLGGVDVCFEALGSPITFRQGTRMLADGGRLVLVGIAAGAARGEVDITPMVRRGQSIVGSFGGRTRQDLPHVVSLAEQERFPHPGTISARFGLDDVDAAYAALDTGQILGRAIVTMA